MDGRDARRPFVRFVRDHRPDHRDDDGRAHPAPAARPFPPLGAQLAAGADPGVADARRRLRRRVGNVQQRLGRRLRHRNGTPAERKHRYGGVLHRVAGRLDSDGRLHQPQFHQYGQPRRQRAGRQERQAGGNGGAEGAVVAVARRLPSPGRGGRRAGGACGERRARSAADPSASARRGGGAAAGAGRQPCCRWGAGRGRGRRRGGRSFRRAPCGRGSRFGRRADRQRLLCPQPRHGRRSLRGAYARRGRAGGCGRSAAAVAAGGRGGRIRRDRPFGRHGRYGRCGAGRYSGRGGGCRCGGESFPGRRRTFHGEGCGCARGGRRCARRGGGDRRGALRCAVGRTPDHDRSLRPVEGSGQLPPSVGRAARRLPLRLGGDRRGDLREQVAHRGDAQKFRHPHSAHQGHDGPHGDALRDRTGPGGQDFAYPEFAERHRAKPQSAGYPHHRTDPRQGDHRYRGAQSATSRSCRCIRPCAR